MIEETTKTITDKNFVCDNCGRELGKTNTRRIDFNWDGLRTFSYDLCISCYSEALREANTKYGLDAGRELEYCYTAETIKE